MKMLSVPVILLGALCLTSCGLLRTATQVPLRTLQSLGRGVGLGIEQTEVKEQADKEPEIRFEVKEGRKAR